MRTVALLARLGALALTAAAACSNESSPTSENGHSENDGGTPRDSGDGAPPDSGSADSGRAECEVPTEKGALFAYLKTATYRAFPAESKVHASAGPHGGNVRTYISRELESSLRAGNAEHPACAAAVKELYGNGTTTLTGYAVQVKRVAASEGGANWYFYETFDANTGSPAIEGNGESLCVDCHGSGRDFIRTPYPLQ